MTSPTPTAPTSPLVALISESAVKEFGGKDPIGEQIDLGDPATVVGIVSDARRRSLDAPPRPAVYLPYTQFVLPYMGAVVRTDGPRSAPREGAVARSIPTCRSATSRRWSRSSTLTSSTGEPRFRSFLIASFAGLALLLAAVGVYGLISFTVTQRVPEIGVRLALGASPRQVFSAGHRPGPAPGRRSASCSAWSPRPPPPRCVRGLLFNTSATDPLVYGSLSALLLAMAALACYVPARRAMRVDPMTALAANRLASRSPIPDP